MRDLWRTDDHGPRLTLRQVWVYLVHLPRDSSLAIDDNGGQMPWSVAEHLAADLWELQANKGRERGKPPIKHSGRAQQKSKNLERKAVRKSGAYAKAKARNAARLASARHEEENP
ncbi:hypothetical protein ACTHQY_08915 [Rhodococcoides corynebacterioides]|uniref:hypothetical protein n=1 Tax=Rhodococcoides corynebacterioides TaxID=53972 RepID=UPI003F7EF066